MKDLEFVWSSAHEESEFVLRCVCACSGLVLA